jgi:hypothetical protein
MLSLSNSFEHIFPQSMLCAIFEILCANEHQARAATMFAGDISSRNGDLGSHFSGVHHTGANCYAENPSPERNPGLKRVRTTKFLKSSKPKINLYKNKR